jgi:hypothetical protein
LVFRKNNQFFKWAGLVLSKIMNTEQFQPFFNPGSHRSVLLFLATHLVVYHTEMRVKKYMWFLISYLGWFWYGQIHREIEIFQFFSRNDSRSNQNYFIKSFSPFLKIFWIQWKWEVSESETLILLFHDCNKKLETF